MQINLSFFNIHKKNLHFYRNKIQSLVFKTLYIKYLTAFLRCLCQRLYFALQNYLSRSARSTTRGGRCLKGLIQRHRTFVPALCTLLFQLFIHVGSINNAHSVQNRHIMVSRVHLSHSQHFARQQEIKIFLCQFTTHLRTSLGSIIRGRSTMLLLP